MATLNAGKDKKKSDHLFVPDEKVKWYGHAVKEVALSIKTKHGTKIMSWKL